MLDTMPNLSGLHGWQLHRVALPQMCPVSGNPQSGSYVAIRYQDAGCFLEVYSLERYLLNYVNGWVARGIRDMEQTIDTIAHDCAMALGVRVTIRAHLVLDSGRMTRSITADPNT